MTQPRVIRHRDAPAYLGTNEHRFNEEIRPHLIEVPIGSIGIGYDRLDLDAYWEEYKARVGRPGRQPGENKCRKKHPVYSKGAKPGTSQKPFAASEFEKALAKAKGKTQNAT